MGTKIKKSFQKSIKWTKFNKEYFDTNKKHSDNYHKWIIESTQSREKHRRYHRSIKCGQEYTNYETGEIYTRYCGVRTCANCAQYKIKLAMKKYQSLIEEMKEKYFVTLTAETVTNKKLKSRLKNMQKSWQQIRNMAKKSEIEINGIKKLEVVNAYPHGNKARYHPHYHILIDSEKGAKYIINHWLKTMKKLEGKNSVKAKNQDIREADQNSIIELFKYTLKPVKTVETNGNKKTVVNKLKEKIIVSGKQEDNRNQSLKGKRTYQAFGNIYNAIKSDLKKV